MSLDWVVSYAARPLQLERQSRHHASAKSRVLVREEETGKLQIEYRGRKLGFQQIAERPVRAPAPTSLSALRGRTGSSPHKPSLEAKL